MSDPSARSTVRTAVTRAVVTAGILFLLALAALTVSAWFSSEDEHNLPFGYAGFDQKQ
jgi:hypothetical protein